MAKGQKHGNKEARKPKADKPVVAPAAVPSFLEKAGAAQIGTRKKR
jgi:hypothetical protein